MAEVKIDKSIDLSDIKAICEEKGIDIRELAKQAAMLKNGEIETTEKKVAVKKAAPKPKKEFEVTCLAYPDIVITKKSPRITSQLIIMPSTQAYFIKRKQGQEETIEKLNRDNYAEFTSNMEDVPLPDAYWMRRISKGKEFFDYLNAYLKSPGIVEMIKDKCAPKMEENKWARYSVQYYQRLPKLCKEFARNEKAMALIKGATDFIEDLVQTFGLQNARDYLNELGLSLINVESTTWSSVRGFYSQAYNRNYYGTTFRNSGRPNVPMEYKAFKEYTLYMPVRLGYARNMQTFFQDWNDSLKMQEQIYGKIKEKYPKDLPTYHNQLAYKSFVMKEEIDKVGFERNSTRCQAFEKNLNGFCFTTPRCKQDMLDEATMQANCLASYTDRYAKGESDIYFMRLKSSPEQSLVTIEVRDGVVTQAYQAHNARCTAKQKAAINRWCKLTNVAKVPYTDDEVKFEENKLEGEEDEKN